MKTIHVLPLLPAPLQATKVECSASLPLNTSQINSFVSRRGLTLFTNSSLFFLLSSHCLEPLNLHKARAEEQFPQFKSEEEDSPEIVPVDSQPSHDVVQEGSDSSGQVPQIADIGDERQGSEGGSSSPSCDNRIPTSRAFLDVSIDGKPAGRIVFGLFGKNVPVGTARFSGLVSGTAGITYRRKEFIKIMPNYIQHGGVRSYGVDAELASQTGGGLEAETLLTEWQAEYMNCPGLKNVQGALSIVVRDPSKPPPKIKLIARRGKFEIQEEEVGIAPNGSEFVIATKDSPELDASNLVIGKVLEGMEVVRRIGEVKTVQENTSSPYFRVAKLIGDKRAVVAERGFNRPYSKVIITNCGLMQ